MRSDNRFDDRKLREEALKAFVKALRTDRMVAVTGAMSTRALGYPSWKEFTLAYAAIADRLAGKILKKRGYDRNAPVDGASTREEQILRNIREDAAILKADADKSERLLDPRVAMWALNDGFRRLDTHTQETRAGLVVGEQYQAPAVERFERKLARLFASRTRGPGLLKHAPGPAAIRPIIEDLGIKRVATLNYDLELEAAFMLRADERDRLKDYVDRHPQVFDGDDIGEGFAKKAAKFDKMASVIRFVGSVASGKPIIRTRRNHLSRKMGNGVHVESDIVDRERPDRLFEFAVGSGEVDRHILHLHGRADSPDSMIANIRQYDRLYRLDDLYRDPFDFSLRVLFGGNPILFVGIGMTEDELNQVFQYFVSNAPVRRSAPMFLIWNTTDLEDGPEKDEIIRKRRLNFRRRLGVHVIFDDDLRDCRSSTSREDWAVEGGQEAARLRGLAEALSKLPDLVRRLDRPVVSDVAWRSIESRTRKPGPVRMWGAEKLREMAAVERSDAGISLGRIITSPSMHDSQSNLVFAATEPGFGRGELGERIIQMPEGGMYLGDAAIRWTRPNCRLLINAGFSYDSDAMLAGIATFLAKLAQESTPDPVCRELAFASGRLLRTKGDENALVIINGADRFFGFDGAPLSAELDHLLRCAKRTGKVQFVLLGTERLQPYCELIGERLQRIDKKDSVPREEEATTKLEQLGGVGRPLGSSYLDWIARNFATRRNEIAARLPQQNKKKKGRVDPSPGQTASRMDITESDAARLGHVMRTDRNSLTRAFFDTYLSPLLLSALDVKCPVSFEILRTMCFIGAPVEAGVLLHAPKVAAILSETEIEDRKRVEAEGWTGQLSEGDLARSLCLRIKDLRDLGLIIELEPYQGDRQLGASRAGLTGDLDDPCGKDFRELGRRYGLHRSLATYLRDRHGAPINDAKLASTFNMSLFMSEPSDNYSPEPNFHDELGDLVDNLIGGWHDIERFYGAQPEPRTPPDPDADLVDRLYVHPKDRDAAISAVQKRSGRVAASCLRAALSIVRGYYSTGALLKLDRHERIANAERDGALTEHAQRLDRLIGAFSDIAASRAIMAKSEEAKDHLGPEPFYADDLVWLYNERGVVALAQGHLFDARQAFSAAQTANNMYVEPDYHGHNWRRITLNLVATLIERGTLKPAERMLGQIDATINSAPWREKRGGERGSRVEGIRRMFRRRSDPPVLGDASHTREELVIAGMTTGYRGLIAHVQGRYHNARDFYQSAIEMFRRLGEQRAFAHFERHYASLQSFIGDKESARREIEYSITAAQSAQQMDVLHRARIVRADIQRTQETDPLLRRHALQDIKNALQYASLSDCYRARIEASASLARHMRQSGDYDTALRYATDAMTVASRYGHSLQKTSLRIEIGQILIARGDPFSGKAMLEQAVKIGTRKGYQQALESVRRANNALAARAPLPNRTDIPISP